jgi:hypothetical protein
VDEDFEVTILTAKCYQNGTLLVQVCSRKSSSTSFERTPYPAILGTDTEGSVLARGLKRVVSEAAGSLTSDDKTL